MAKSEIKDCLFPIDFFSRPEVYGLSSEEKVIYAQCVLLGAKNNLGIFIKHRDQLASSLLVSVGSVINFYNRNPNLIFFEEGSHITWVKKSSEYTNFGIKGKLFRMKKRDGFLEKQLNTAERNKKNNFITKIRSSFDEYYLKNHPNLKKEWVKQNYLMLYDLNEELKQLPDNNRDLNDFLSLI